MAYFPVQYMHCNVTPGHLKGRDRLQKVSEGVIPLAMETRGLCWVHSTKSYKLSIHGTEHLAVGNLEREVKTVSFVANLAHFGNHFLPIMAHFSMPN